MRRFIGTLEFARRYVGSDIKDLEAKAAFMAPIAQTIDRVRGAIFLMMFPPQVFKSLLMQLRLARGVAVEPVLALWYSTTGKGVLGFADEKLSRLLESIPACVAQLPNDRDARGSKTILKYTQAPVSLLGANTEEHRNSRSGQDLYLDEAWQWRPGELREILKRSDDYEVQRRVIIGTTGSEVDDEVDTLWEQSTKYEWRVACVSCSSKVPCEFGYPHLEGGIKFESNETTREPNGRWKAEAAARTAVWERPACKARHRYNPTLVDSLNSPARGAGYELTNPGHRPNVFGWHAEATCFRDWETITAEFLNANNAKFLGTTELIEEFQRKRRVRAWDPRMIISSKRELPLGDYNLADPWPDEGLEGEVPLRFLWIDVQQNHFWAVCRSWSNKRETWAHSRLRFFEKLFSAGQIEDVRKQLKIVPNRVCIDSAYNQQMVYQICSNYGYLAANSVKVRDFGHFDGVRRIYSEAHPIDALAGFRAAGQFNVVEIKYSTPGSWYRLDALRSSRTPDGKPIWTIARDTPEEYIKQAWAEIMERKRTPQGGWAFQIRQIGSDNHAQDMERGQVTSASMFGLLGAETLEPVSGEDSKSDGPPA